MLQNIVCSYLQVLIFAEKKADVDAIHEYLLLKGVEAVAIHGGKGTQNSILTVKIHINQYIVIVLAKDYCIWRNVQPSSKFISEYLSFVHTFLTLL